MKAPETASLAHLQHDLRTPINHIVGYAELLIEDAGERHLEAFLPAFQQIQNGGHRMLESIRHIFAEETTSVQVPDFQALKEDLRITAREVLETSTLMLEELESGHQQTLADLHVISQALCRLMEFTGKDEEPLVKESSNPFLGTVQASLDNISVSRKEQAGQILIADDDAGNRALLRRRLELDGHCVMEATNGLEVLALLKNHTCDLILLDIMMPEMDGFQTLAKLKREPELRDLPVIMISALDELRSVVSCIEMGAEDYLPKPFNRVLLRARIGASLEKKWLRNRERRKTKELERALRLLEQAQVQMETQASQDALTQLANRRAVDAHLELRFKRDTPFSVIYIDLNGFKKINDTYGHQAGDDLLKQVGERLRLAFRPTDIVGRWGGDEFVALVDVGVADAQNYILRINRELSQEFAISSGEAQRRVNVSAAVGVATWHPGETIMEVLQRADAEMYHQKLRSVST